MPKPDMQGQRTTVIYGSKPEKMTKRDAALVLEDELCDLSRWINNAECVVQELTDEYFGMHDPDPNRRQAWVLYGYERAGAFADILQDILLKLRAVSEKLEGYQRGAE